MLKKPKFIKPLSTYHPSLLSLAIKIKQFDREMDMLFSKEKYSNSKNKIPLKYRIKKHKSKLIRKLDKDQMYMQYNKIKNLQIVVESLNGTIIKPNEVFSYFKLLGKPTKKRGFKEGMELRHGVPRGAIGGGICQSSNLIYWIVLHSPLEIIERHHHSFDPFPDDKRVLPFASGATVMYNYIDLQFKNPTPYDIQLLLSIDDEFLYGELRVEGELKHSYKVYEKNHYFEKIDNDYFRSNELHRKVIDKNSGNTINNEFIVRNYSGVKYIPTKEKFNAKFSCDLD